jgi:hypothetical protein
MTSKHRANRTFIACYSVSVTTPILDMGDEGDENEVLALQLTEDFGKSRAYWLDILQGGRQGGMV